MYLTTHRHFSSEIRPVNSPIDIYPHAFEPSRLVTAAARCWVTAITESFAPRAALHNLLAPFGCETMTATFERLMTLFSRYLGRPIELGDAFLSNDEEALIELIRSEESTVDYAGCSDLIDVAFECAARLNALRCRVQQ